MSRRPLAVRAYAALLRLLPGDLRAAHGRDAAATFHDLYRDARTRDGFASGARLFATSGWRLVRCAVASRRDGARVARPGVIGHVSRDIRHGLRALIATPTYSLTALLIVGVGIGATTTIVSVVDTVVLRQMPYPSAERLVHFDNGTHSMPSFISWRALASFEDVAAARDVRVDLTGEGPPARLPGARVSAQFFRMFGGAPAIGRVLAADDYTEARRVVVLGHDIWTRIFGGDHAIVGRAVTLNGEPVTVIGVLSSSFAPPEIETGTNVDFWLPLVETPEAVADHNRYILGIVGRLGPGVTVEAAQAEVDAQRAEVARRMPDKYVNRDGNVDPIPLVPLREATIRNVSQTLYLLLGAVGVMLLIACANVASLLLARGIARTRELALRKALGASGWRLMSLVLTESVVLALAGGLLGVALTYGGVALFGALDPGGIPRIGLLEVDARVLGFALLASIATGVVFGVLPALQARRARVSDALKAGAGTLTAHRAGRRTRQALVVAELALAIVLLASAGLLFRSFIGRISVAPGFDPDHLTVVALTLDAGYDDARRLRFATDLHDALIATPGIASAAAGWTVPFRFTGRGRCCWRTRVAGDPALVDAAAPATSIVHPVTPRYFATLGAPVTAGREFTDADGAGGRQVSIVNAVAARDLFGTTDVIGRALAIGDTETTVVGVVPGLHHWGLDQDIERAVYVPYAQHGAELADLHFVVRSSLEASAVADAARSAIARLDASLPIGRIVTMDSEIDRSVAGPKFLTALFGTFAGVALLLACGGLYGSMLYTVNQRKREMGIRLALGADPGRVVRLVLRRGLVLTALGVGIGTIAALAASRLLTDLVWGIEPDDPLTIAFVGALLGFSALLACLGPAWRAGRTDPLWALRAD